MVELGGGDLRGVTIGLVWHQPDRTKQTDQRRPQSLAKPPSLPIVPPLLHYSTSLSPRPCSGRLRKGRGTIGGLRRHATLDVAATLVRFHQSVDGKALPLRPCFITIFNPSRSRLAFLHCFPGAEINCNVEDGIVTNPNSPINLTTLRDV
jgi:hypothetical protein